MAYAGLAGQFCFSARVLSVPTLIESIEVLKNKYRIEMLGMTQTAFLIHPMSKPGWCKSSFAIKFCYLRKGSVLSLAAAVLSEFGRRVKAILGNCFFFFSVEGFDIVSHRPIDPAPSSL